MDDPSTLIPTPPSDPAGATPPPDPSIGMSPPPAEPPPQSVESAPETFVVPPAGDAPVNPFIPQGVGDTTAASQSAPPPPPIPGNNGLMKKILMGVVGVVIIILLVLAGKFVVGVLTTPKEITITYWGLWENDATVRAVINDFEAQHPKIKVEYVKQSQRQYRERLEAAIARGEGPDVFRFHNTWVPMIHASLATVPPTVMGPSEFESVFYPVAKADLVGGQNIYGIPIMIDGLALYYNEDLFTTAGATPPTTWEDVLNLVPKLTVKKDDGTIVTSAIALGTTGNVEHFSDIIATMFMQNGAKLTQPTGIEAEQAIQFYHKFADKNDPVYTWNETLDNSIYAFSTGKVAMILAPSWRAFDLQQMNPQLHFKIVPMPQLPGNTVTWASYWVEGVSAKTTHPEQSWEFMKYLTSRDAVTKLYTEASKTRLFGEPYARVELGSSLAGDPFVGAYIKQASTARSFPLASRTFDNGLNDNLIQYMENAVNAVGGGTAPSAALTTAADGFTQVLAKYGLVSAAAPTSQ